MANSDDVQIGDQVVVIGAPYGLTYSMSVGWISARWPPNTVYKSMPLAEFFQTDAVINQGNSGGPMFNLAGDVVGIVSHNISKSGGSEGLGFVVTINTAKKLLLEQRSFWSGLEGRLLTTEQADLFNLPPRSLGYLVTKVATGSPGEDRAARWHERRGDRRRVDAGGRRHHSQSPGNGCRRPFRLREDPRGISGTAVGRDYPDEGVVVHRSCCCGMERATGIARTGSRAGPMWICQNEGK